MDDLFSAATARQRRDAGMDLAAGRENAQAWLLKARDCAYVMAVMGREVSADDVLSWCPRPSDVHPNATGSIFRDKRFKLIGYRTSKKVSAHARRIGIYELNLDQ